MGFILAKIILLLILPPGGILVLLLCGLFLLHRYRAGGSALVGLAVVLLYLLSIAAVSGLLLRPLEAAYPPFTGTKSRVDAVVVLGGGVRDLSWVPLRPELSGRTLQRLVAGIEIARAVKAPLVLSGGTGAIAPSPAREADAMAEAAVRLGFPRDRIRVEDRSRNTLENARLVARLIPHANIVLVTSAYHMKRAVAAFRKQGFTVVPAPIGYLVEQRPPSWSNLIPRIGDLDASATAIAERLSLAWYGMQNNI
jgi:uncharacterized SAM-binding protein YcdF (DUF218 family)